MNALNFEPPFVRFYCGLTITSGTRYHLMSFFIGYGGGDVSTS